MELRELRTDRDIDSAFPLMSTLRERIRRDSFLSEVRRQQQDGYRLIGGFDGPQLVGLAGVRRMHTLARRSNAASRDAAPAECRPTSVADC